MEPTNAANLQIGPGTRLWFSPIEWLWLLGPLPPGVTMVGEFAGATVAVVFVSNVPSLRSFLNRHRTVVALPPAVWVCYPTPGRPDFHRGNLVSILAGHGLGSVGEVVLDPSWSALRVRPAMPGHPPPVLGRGA